jgi:hypothetical protein
MSLLAEASWKDGSKMGHMTFMRVSLYEAPCMDVVVTQEQMTQCMKASSEMVSDMELESSPFVALCTRVSLVEA